MKLTFKSVAKKETFAIEDVEPSTTIADVKKRIEASQGHEAALQKLIYSGKILADDKTVESYSIKEKDFLVCMVSKPKAAPKAAAAAAPAATSSSSASKAEPQTPAPAANQSRQEPPPAPAPAQAAPVQPAAAADTPAPIGRSSAPRDTGDFTSGSEREGAITMLLEMGYDRPQVEQAMRAAFNNTERAAEYLITGIPEHLIREQTAPRQQQPAPATPSAQPRSQPAAAATQQQGQAPSGNLFEQAAQAAGGGGAGGAGGAGAEGADAAGANANLDFLRNDPQFQQLRTLIQQNPQMLEPILQQLAAGNPQLASLISSSPEAFLQLLAEGGDEDEEGGMGEGILPPGSQRIQVTPEENAAIERLCNLGFDQQMVLQAYFACDKNEEVAANYLLEHGHDDDEDD